MAKPFRLAAIALVALAEVPSVHGETLGVDYFTLFSCRVYDTRPVHDPLQGGPGRRRDIQVAGVCGVPAGSTAVAVNLTALNASRTGSLAVYDAGLASAPMLYSALSLPPGRVRANSAIVELSADGKIAAELSAEFASLSDTADLVIDVLGYFSENAGLRILKSTNGQDANFPPGPSIAPGSPVLWEYYVTNVGEVTLSSIQVTDNRGVTVTCPKTSLRSGESMRCTGNGLAQACQYSNVGTATGRTPEGQTVGDDDPSHYFGELAANISIRTRINGQEADIPPGPEILVGSPTLWTYTVTNTGNIALGNVRVIDSGGVSVACPKTTLQSGESMTCVAQGTATACQYGNIGRVTAMTAQCGSQVIAEDPSHYFGIPCE